MYTIRILMLPILMVACSPIGIPPKFSEPTESAEHMAMMSAPAPNEVLPTQGKTAQASLWTGARDSLLGDRRAIQRGDILTVVIEIDDSAQISNSTDRSRSAAQSLGVPNFLGLPQRLSSSLPEGASFDSAVDINSSSTASGDGSVSRREKLTLRVAATILDVLPNGILSIGGKQEVRVNFELRELLVSGYVRPEDISRQNEITYDKIASARISYGGQGQITDMQQPRYGQQIIDVMTPF